MGMFFPRTNTWGVFTGLVIALAFGIFVSAGPILAREFNLELLAIHKMSFMWYTTVNFLVTVFVGLIVSEIARCVKPSLKRPVDPSLLVNLLRSKYPKNFDDKSVKQDGFQLSSKETNPPKCD
ncbi:uncharacterized protein [Ptychodera flava]|uniref:uncharacterized protein n=1 Tax=Ptychodera flava TaxID=63121 RepID=UPI00396A421E